MDPSPPPCNRERHAHRGSRDESGRTTTLAVVMVLVTLAIGVAVWQLMGMSEGEAAPDSSPSPTVVAPVAPSSPGSTGLPAIVGTPPEALRAAQVEQAVARDVASVAVDDSYPPMIRGAHASPLLDREQMDALRARLHPKQDAETRMAAAREILDMGPRSPLVSRALEVLGQLDPGSVPGELQRLIESDPDGTGAQGTLANSVRNLAQRDELLSRSDLAYFFEEGSEKVRIAAAASLAQRGDDSLSLRYLELRAGDLSDDDHRVRADAVADLAEVGDTATMNRLLPLLSDESVEVRTAVLSAVRRAEDPAILESIRPLVHDPSPRVRSQATQVVAALERRLERERERERARQERPSDR